MRTGLDDQLSDARIWLRGSLAVEVLCCNVKRRVYIQLWPKNRRSCWRACVG